MSTATLVSVARRAEGVALITVAFRGEVYRNLWTKCKVRKDTRCAITGARLRHGSEAYRPISNQADRMLRIAAYEIDDMEITR